MARFLYTLFFTLLLPFIFFRLWVKGKALATYRKRWKERCGLIKNRQANNNKTIWLHTVSVGEFLAATVLIDNLLASNNINIVITTMTPTGSEQVTKKYADRVFHVYAPYDIPHFIHGFLRATQPDIAIFMETELWPNTLHACYKKNIKTILINSRLSEKSAKGYAKFSALTKPMLQKLTIAAIQNKMDSQRFIQLGLDANKAEVSGSIKFDINLTPELKEQAAKAKHLYTQNLNRQIFIAASTHEGEDKIIIEAFSKAKIKHPELLLILVPRHPERFENVFSLAQRMGFATTKRSFTPDSLSAYDIMIGDTMGELLMLYGMADIAFIGGSLIDNGGHNYIEAAAWSLPMLSGPSQFNFLDIAKQFEQAGSLTTVDNATDMANALDNLLTNDALREQAGKSGLAIIESNTGAVEKTIAIINKQLHA